MELLEHEVEGDRVISLRAKVLDGPYSLSRKLKRNGLYLMNCVNACANNLRKLANNRLCLRKGFLMGASPQNPYFFLKT